MAGDKRGDADRLRMSQLVPDMFTDVEDVCRSCGVDEATGRRFMAGRKMPQTTLDLMQRNLFYNRHRGDVGMRVRNAASRRGGEKMLRQLGIAAKILDAAYGAISIDDDERWEYCFPPRKCLLDLVYAMESCYRTLEKIHRQAPELDGMLFSGTPNLLDRFDRRKR